jgi:formylmethanofuran dehydrogenase subunit B
MAGLQRHVKRMKKEFSIHEKSMPSATPGQIKNRSDAIVFWGCNPVQAHPRHMSRYSSFARGFFTEKCRKGRKIIAVDVRKTHIW